jgi:hypothetical protein
MLWPIQTGPLLEAEGTPGVGYKVTVTLPGDVEVHPFTVWVTVYKPAMPAVTLLRITVEPLAVPPSGKVQLKVAPVWPVAFRVKVLPLQIGLGDAAAVGAAGVWFTVTAVQDDNEVHPATVWVAQ